MVFGVAIFICSQAQSEGFARYFINSTVGSTGALIMRSRLLPVVEGLPVAQRAMLRGVEPLKVSPTSPKSCASALNSPMSCRAPRVARKLERATIPCRRAYIGAIFLWQGAMIAVGGATIGRMLGALMTWAVLENSHPGARFNLRKPFSRGVEPATLLRRHHSRDHRRFHRQLRPGAARRAITTGRDSARVEC